MSEKTGKKMGRPTNSPKIHQTRIRMTDDELEKLEYCAKKLDMTKTDIINKGVENIYNELKKKKK